MANQDVGAARAYHEATKLSYINLKTKPAQFKDYPILPAIPLPTGFPPPNADALDAVAGMGRAAGASLDLTALAHLLFFSAGLVRKVVFPRSGEVHFRAASSAGGLYPVEVYILCKDIPGLEAGVYHFSPQDFVLQQLRKGDYRGELARAAGGDPEISSSEATLIYTAIFWRSAWKYRARSYRYCFWDNGTIAANLLATASTLGLPALLCAGFVDDSVNRLVGVSGEDEASLCLIPVGGLEGAHAVAHPLALEPLSQEVNTPADAISYPEICALHRSSALNTPDEVTAWRGFLEARPAEVGGHIHPVRANAAGAYGSEVRRSLDEVIRNRGSTRRFDSVPIPETQFSAILHRSTRGIKADFLGTGGESLLDVYVIVNAVEGLSPGSYVISRKAEGLELLAAGDFRAEAGHVCFEQALAADASAVFFLMADLERVLGRFGNRGYRAAQLEAGIVGGKIYLSAYSFGLGASGLTFYDDDATSFFSPHAEGKSPIFVVALGVPASRNVVRPFRSRVGVVLDALSRGAKKGAGDASG